MNDQSDLVGRLEALGRSQPHAPSADRVRSIEERVLASSRVPVARRRRAMPVLLAAAAVIAVVVLGVLALGPRGDDLVVSAAEGVTLEYADGRTTSAEPGDALPDGTVIVVEPRGRLVADGDLIGPGRYLVVDGAFLPSDPAATGSTTTTTATTATTTTTTSTIRTAPSDATVPTRPPVGERATTTVPAVPPTTTEDRDVTTTTARRDRDPSTTTPITTTTTTTPIDRATTTIVDRPATTSTTAAERDRPADRPTTTSGDGR